MIDEKVATLFGIEADNAFDQVSIRIASPEEIRSWSFGEVKTPETINYRTFKPEKDGLFCERIFGPTKDWECACGKYKRIKHKGTVCDRCGVEVTLSNVRRERMGVIELAVPVSHIWFLKSPPSRISNVLGLSIKDLERIIYYEYYAVIDPGNTPLKLKQLVNDEEYRQAQADYGSDAFLALMGAEAVKELLKREDLDQLTIELKEKIDATKSQQTIRRLAKRLRIIENFRNSGCRPEWMILDAIPVIPPDLRPLVPLEGGRFATSDLNDLYRRVINRNNRLKNILQLKTPDVIVRNEKRMLQEAVDALFDNGKQGRPVVGANGRALKSLSDNLRGKQGRFRQNLLGKRVDYSGRSVIVIGPELKLNQCGLPKKMALELFEPFIIRRLKELGYVHTLRSAKKLIERKTKEVWDVLDEVIKDHPVLLNRAPTLHRLGIQAFDPILVEGDAIRVHPLVCTAFNADFDGDQMAVHVPLSNEAQLEARVLMYAPNNIFSPASGEPIANPTQDIAIGCYYLTRMSRIDPEPIRVMSDREEAILAYAEERLGLHEKVKVRIEGELIDTTVGRILFNKIFPDEIAFINEQVNKRVLSEVITECYKKVGHEGTVRILDALKDMGFESSTWSGVSLGMGDMVIPPEKDKILKRAHDAVNTVSRQYEQERSITARERYNKVIDIWTHAADELSQQVFRGLEIEGEDPGLNPLFMMVDSGARGSRQQVQQLAGMRGLMAKPSGEVIENPITANFREGLSVLQYFISTHGARKGLADTALKTADSGYLTRRLVDVAQDVIICEEDCGTIQGRTVRELMGQGEVIIPIRDRILGRFALETIKDRITGEVVVKAGEEITEPIAQAIERLGLTEVKVRSVLTCEASKGVCAKCYGINLAAHRRASMGDSVGIIAAQSIGEPGTQLTMRTFHIGGTASLFARRPEIISKSNAIVKYDGLKGVKIEGDKFKVLHRGGTLALFDSEGPKARELDRHKLEIGTVIMVPDGGQVKKKGLIAEWDPYNIPVLTDKEGQVEFIDIIEGETMEVKKGEDSGIVERVISPSIGQEKHPQIAIRDADTREVLAYYTIPTGAVVDVEDGASVKAGDRLARTPRKMIQTKDITGGLPRVAELFEARNPKDAAEIAKISGMVEFKKEKADEKAEKRGKRRLIVKDPATGTEEEHLIPMGQHITVRSGDWVEKGQQLTEGPIVLQELLDVCGMETLEEYLVNQVQEVYRTQGVVINDKHIEVIVRQMLSKVWVVDPGDTSFLFDEKVNRFRFLEENRRIREAGGRPAKSKNLLLGITKASLSTESFISAASFQETTRILTDAAASGKIDELKGFKENVIMGHLIPAGTGYPALKDTRVAAVLEPGEEEPVVDVIEEITTS